MNYDKLKIKIKLKEMLNREPKEHEILNAKGDINIISRLLEEEVDDLKKRVSKLEKP